MDGHKEAQDLLKERGLRRTAGRVRLLAYLLRARRPLSHADIMEGLGKASADRVSVYRNLETFAEHGIVHRAYVDDRTWLFETSDRCGDTVCHPHFTCRVCGQIKCMTDWAVDLPLRPPPHYEIERIQIHLQGVCPRCSDGET